MKLFYVPGTAALACLIAMEEVGADYEPIRLDFKTGDQRKPEYLSVNPKGRVPALVTDDGILTEAPAVLSFIAQNFPASRLLPDAVFAAAQVQEFNSFLCSTAHISHAHRVRGIRWSDDADVIENLKLKVAQNMAEHFTYLEERFDGPWVMGEAYTISDPYLFTISRWLEGDGVDIKSFPKISAHHERMLERPAVQKALAIQA